ncbi:MAG: ZIP family metal transporter, partial [Burkholderiales bacterium]|nr:ZIP family metal transporter [Burkholderiales bacterium]
AGALLSTAFMHLMPEAFESAAGAHDLFAVFLGGVVFFFLLDKVELYHHGHEHHHGHTHGAPAPHDVHAAHAQPHTHEHGGSAHVHTLHGHANSGATMDATGSNAGITGGWAVLAGDSVHAFGDGILIASAFMADWTLGLVTSLAVLAHEVPHHMGDLVVLRATTGTQRAALVKVSLAGTVTAMGGLVGYFLVRQLDEWLPFFLVVASSSFVYVALADLIPQLQKRLNLADTLAQLGWLLAGVGLVVTVSGLAHGH